MFAASIKKPAALVCLLAGLAASELAAPRQPKNNDVEILAGLTRVVDKLEAYATGESLLSGITFDELMHVAGLYENWAPEMKEAARKSPTMHMAIDFAITPMKMIAYQIQNDPLLIAKHLNRVEDAYKRFRPAFLGAQIGDKDMKIRMNNINILYRILAGSDKETKLTVTHFLRAKAEAESWRARLDELTTHEDIFGSLKELESILNYFNAPVLKPLFKYIYPNLQRDSDPDQLAQEYHERLWADEGIKYVNGNPTLYLGRGKPSTLTPGFTHVALA